MGNCKVCGSLVYKKDICNLCKAAYNGLKYFDMCNGQRVYITIQMLRRKKSETSFK